MELTCFYAVLQEHSSAHDMVDHVVLNHDIMSVYELFWCPLRWKWIGYLPSLNACPVN